MYQVSLDSPSAQSNMELRKYPPAVNSWPVSCYEAAKSSPVFPHFPSFSFSNKLLDSSRYLVAFAVTLPEKNGSNRLRRQSLKPSGKVESESVVGFQRLWGLGKIAGFLVVGISLVDTSTSAPTLTTAWVESGKGGAPIKASDFCACHLAE